MSNPYVMADSKQVCDKRLQNTKDIVKFSGDRWLTALDLKFSLNVVSDIKKFLLGMKKSRFFVYISREMWWSATRPNTRPAVD